MKYHKTGKEETVARYTKHHRIVNEKKYMLDATVPTRVTTGNRKYSQIRISGRCPYKTGEVGHLMREVITTDMAGTRQPMPLGAVSDTCIQCPLETSVLKSSDKAQLLEVNKMII